MKEKIIKLITDKNLLVISTLIFILNFLTPYFFDEIYILDIFIFLLYLSGLIGAYMQFYLDLARYGQRDIIFAFLKCFFWLLLVIIYVANLFIFNISFDDADNISKIYISQVFMFFLLAFLWYEYFGEIGKGLLFKEQVKHIVKAIIISLILVLYGYAVIEFSPDLFFALDIKIPTTIIIIYLVFTALFGVGLAIAWIQYYNKISKIKKEEKLKAEKIEQEKKIRKQKLKEERRIENLQEITKKLPAISEKLVQAIQNSPYKDNFYIGDILYDELITPYMIKESEKYSKNIEERIEVIAENISKIKNDDKLYIRATMMCIEYNKDKKIFIPRGKTFDFDILTNGDLVQDNGKFLGKYTHGFMHNYNKVYWKEKIEKPESGSDKTYKWHFVGFVKNKQEVLNGKERF